MNALLRIGRSVFALAIIALGAENIVRAHDVHSIPALPFLPPIPWLAILFGILWVACGVGLLTQRWLRPSAYTLGVTYIFWTSVHVLPKYIALPGDMGLRTVVLEPLSLACIAILLPGPASTPKWLALICRIAIAIAMIVFGVDHFLGIGFIASLIPGWIPGTSSGLPSLASCSSPATWESVWESSNAGAGSGLARCMGFGCSPSTYRAHSASTAFPAPSAIPTSGRVSSSPWAYGADRGPWPPTFTNRRLNPQKHQAQTSFVPPAPSLPP
jgi:uncharacterized membrane protein